MDKNEHSFTKSQLIRIYFEPQDQIVTKNFFGKYILHASVKSTLQFNFHWQRLHHNLSCTMTQSYTIIKVPFSALNTGIME